MLALSLAEIADRVDGHLNPAAHDIRVQGVCTDSRAVVRDALFVAIKGERFDGNDSAADALQQGAAACLVNAAHPASSLDRAVAVEDTVLAFGVLAHAWRMRFDIPALALTGSNGKTTVKEMLRTIMLEHVRHDAAQLLVTQGNLNNHIGVPITLCRMSAQNRYAIIEAGMNHFGELATLTRLIAPSVALINNAAPAHLEGLGSLEGVARAKGEILGGLSAGGVAVLNRDDQFFNYWQSLVASHRIISFGKHADATVRGQWDERDSESALHVNVGDDTARVMLRVAGAHNRMNALAAIAGAHALGVSLETSSIGLAKFNGVDGRHAVRKGARGATVIDDTYNANPSSMLAAFDTLATRKGRKIAVLGQMAELGEAKEWMHAELGRALAERAIDRALVTGPLMQHFAKASDGKAQWFANKSELIEALTPMLTQETTVLVKGSRSSAMEDVVAALMNSDKNKECTACC